MDAHEVEAPNNHAPAPVAARGQSLGFLAIAAAVVGFGNWAQTRPTSASAPAGGQLATHAVVCQGYLAAIALDWALFTRARRAPQPLGA